MPHPLLRHGQISRCNSITIPPSTSLLTTELGQKRFSPIAAHMVTTFAIAHRRFSLFACFPLPSMSLLFLVACALSATVPHFEKMLYDQGQLANAYLNAFCITKDVFYSSLFRDILDYLRRDMIGPTGEIFSAEDADSLESEDASRKKEGAFYVWRNSEVEHVVGEDATIVMDHYYIKPSGNCDLSRMSDPHGEFKGKNVLIERNATSAMASKHGLPVERYLDSLGSNRRKLFEVRTRRPRPHLDDKVNARPYVSHENCSWLLLISCHPVY
nr:spermatogenesis-associated protein 20 isoform X2 [Ipomoea batatas]